MNASKLLKTMLGRFRPGQQQPQRLPERQLVAALATLDDNSPALAALLDQLHGQFEENIRQALLFHQPDDKRLRSLDRAAAVLDAAELIEWNRRVAREQREREAQQRENQTPSAA